MYIRQCLHQLLWLILIITHLSACGSRYAPAPVFNLSTTVATAQNLTEIIGDTYQVQKGDTLFAVAFYSGNAYRDLATLNSITYPYTIKIGQTLRLTPPATIITAIQTKKPDKTVQNSNKIEIDPQHEQEYGKGISTNRRNNHHVRLNGKTRSTEKLSWIWPANGNRNIATVGSDGNKRGLDIKGNMGSTIVSAANGKVVYAGNALKGYGNLVIIKHNDDYLSAYAHNKSILVNEQTYVKQGQQIATMGNSGASDVMLHFEIRKKGKSVDPFRYLPAH